MNCSLSRNSRFAFIISIRHNSVEQEVTLLLSIICNNGTMITLNNMILTRYLIFITIQFKLQIAVCMMQFTVSLSPVGEELKIEENYLKTSSEEIKFH